MEKYLTPAPPLPAPRCTTISSMQPRGEARRGCGDGALGMAAGAREGSGLQGRAPRARRCQGCWAPPSREHRFGAQVLLGWTRAMQEGEDGAGDAVAAPSQSPWCWRGALPVERMPCCQR